MPTYKFKKLSDRHRRVRAKISGTPDIPRLNVYRSNTAIYAQMIDDTTGKTLVAASDHGVQKGTKVERAAQVGKDIAAKATKAGIEKCVFDRGGFLYTGRVRALADAARQ